MELRIDQPKYRVRDRQKRLFHRMRFFACLAILAVALEHGESTVAQTQYPQTVRKYPHAVSENISSHGTEAYGNTNVPARRHAPLPEPLPTGSVQKSLTQSSPQQPKKPLRQNITRDSSVDVPLHGTRHRPVTNPVTQRSLRQKPPMPPNAPNIAEAPPGNPAGENLLGASTSVEAMREASRSIPWNRLSPKAKAKAQAVLADKTIYRRLPQQMVRCEPILYRYFLEHPDVIVAIWEKLGVTQITLKEYRPGVYDLKETVGTTCRIEVLHRTENICVLYAKGSYTGPFIPKTVDGEAILCLKSAFEKDEDGEPCLVAQLDAFVSVKNFGVDLFAKLFAPMLGKIADSNFEQTLAFIGNVSDVAQSNPEAVKRMALKLETIPKEVRDELTDIAYRTARNSLDRYEDDTWERSPYGRNLLDSHEKYVRTQWSENIAEFDLSARIEQEFPEKNASGTRERRFSGTAKYDASQRRIENPAPGIPHKPIDGTVPNPQTPKRIEIIPRNEYKTRISPLPNRISYNSPDPGEPKNYEDADETPIMIFFEEQAPKIAGAADRTGKIDEIQETVEQYDSEEEDSAPADSQTPVVDRKIQGKNNKTSPRQAIFKKPTLR